MEITGLHLMTKGGEWLGVARSWIQWTFRNGDRVTWGSDDLLHGDVRVADVERLASDVAAVAINEYRSNPTRLCPGEIPTQNAMEAEGLFRVLGGMNLDGLEFWDRDGKKLLMHYHYDPEKGGVIVCRPSADFTLTQRWAAEESGCDSQPAK